MKVKFTADEEIRDPKTGSVISSFKKGDEVELSPSGAAYFFAKGSAEPVEKKPALPDTMSAETGSATAAETVEKSGFRKRQRE